LFHGYSFNFNSLAAIRFFTLFTRYEPLRGNLACNDTEHGSCPVNRPIPTDKTHISKEQAVKFLRERGRHS